MPAHPQANKDANTLPQPTSTVTDAPSCAGTITLVTLNAAPVKVLELTVTA